MLAAAAVDSAYPRVPALLEPDRQHRRESGPPPARARHGYERDDRLQEIFDAARNLFVDRPVSEFVFHPGPNHRQMTAVARFEIRTAADDGLYYLVSTSKPDSAFLETTTANNTAWTSFQLTRDSNGNAKIAEVSHSPCSGTLCGVDLPNR